MKILVFSDSHCNTLIMNGLVEKYKPVTDCIIHLGDCVEDTEDLRFLCPNIPVYQIRGNNDYDGMFPLQRTVTLGGKRLYLCHGHRHRVYYNTDQLYYSAAQEEADIALFGHTHVPYLENEGGIIVMNPGSITLPRSSSGKTFGTIDIENGKITASIFRYEPSEIQKIRSLEF